MAMGKIYLAARAKRKYRGPKKPALKSIRKIVRKTIQRTAERNHFHSTGSTGTEIIPTWTNFPYSLSGISQGTTDVTRIGDVVHARRLKGKIAIYRKGTATTATVIRLMIFRWNMDNGVETPAMNDILFDDAAANQGHLLSVKKNDLYKKYTILYDRTFPLFAPVAQGSVKLIPININLKNSRILFEAGGTTGTGHIYLGMHSDIATGTNSSNAYWHMELSFTDV